MRLALIAIDEQGYSETFVQAHKMLKADEVLYFFGGTKPTSLEGWGAFVPTPDCHDSKTVGRFLRLFNPVGWWRSGLSIKQYVLYRILKKRKVDVVLAEFGFTAVDVMDVCERLGIPLVVHFHGADVHKTDVALRKRYVRLFGIASALVGVSREMIDTLRSMGAPEEKLVYTPCGPNDMFFEVSPARNDRVFISVGRFVDKKAPHLTIMAFNEALKSAPDIKLKMAGTGPLLNACRELVKELDIQDAVEFLGVLGHEEVRALHSRAFAFLQHSVTAPDGNKEGTPVGVLEAMASSLPVVATRHGGIPDVVVDGQTGFLCEEGDYRRMAADMVRLIENPELAEAMGLRGRERVREHYTLSAHLSTLNQTIERALK